MAGNTYGTLFRITTFGESHGKALGVVIDGCVPGLFIDEDFILKELAKRRPGQSAITTERNEDESFVVISGVFEGRSTGAPICLMVHNQDQRSSDYNQLKDVYRPSHADYTYQAKYGIRDHRGGGRSSARETVARVLAGAVAKLYLKQHGISIQAYVQQVSDISVTKDYTRLDLSSVENNIVRCPEEETAAKMIRLIEQVKQEGDSVGGAISCVIKGVQPGLGEPVFDKLHAELGKAMLSINACKGFEVGSGFEGTTMKGSEHNDAFMINSGRISTTTNHSGGIQGGISNGQDIYFRCAFKPVSTIKKQQQTITDAGSEVTMEAAGRHDPCVLPRAVVIVEAMAAIVLTDFVMRQHALSDKNH
ncbi:MAG: chorismate synthase [Bacteroidota bacterium]